MNMFEKYDEIQRLRKQNTKLKAALWIVSSAFSVQLVGAALFIYRVF
ncbi:hypothetical protein SAMN05216302_101466 [Nitrosomonas aestuarii]|uniref:Uncharacterized protein n=1 Tax=Nitrosomonas aestuarii TaxID=52441 RepID=A0A1I4C2X2_9PROT|nr:hypothetical protein [Nitrosomonas aestuarii]SFK75285.1 hypothetical protein SAMN05216302_101466 [Nitrosomonas aestuarii]